MSDLIPTIYDHYKDTCSVINEAVKRRDRLMIFVLVTVGILAIQGLFPTISNVVINDVMNFKFGITLKLDFSVIGSIVWFLLLIFTLRYFQINVFIERQYSYVHKIEGILNGEIGKEIITREGKSYLSDYPIFSDWMCLLYTLIFPLLLILTATAKIIGELLNISMYGWSLNSGLNFGVFILLLISIVLYLFVHYKNNK